MRRAATPRLGAYAGLTAVGLLAALVLRRPELVALAAPFALVLGAGLAAADRPELRIEVELDRERMIEGDELELRIGLHAAAPVERLDLYAALPRRFEVVEGENPVALRLARGESRELVLRVRAARWGGYVLGRVHVRMGDRIGLLIHEGRVERKLPLRVFPREETLRRLLPALETQPAAGNEVSRRKGEGIEFADIRAYHPGDRPKKINWRASARRGELWVNDAHPERNTDVILFLDSFTEARRADSSTLDLAVRATASLAAGYVGRRDRVGLVSFGGVLRWLLPGMGVIQLYRIVDALLDTEIVLNYAWKDLDVIPTRTLPPAALVIALTPLLDDRAVGSLLDLRARGFDLAVVDVSPVPFTPAPPDEADLDALAYRIWRLRRAALRSHYERMGVAVAEWREGEPLQAPLEEVRAYRRYARPVRA